LRYQVVRSSSEPKAHARLGATETEDPASANLMKSRRFCVQVVIFLSLQL
jgi:hypothetical protein